LNSVLKQDIGGLEAILVNDGSTDSSIIIMKRFQVQNPDLFKVIDGVNMGIGAARNKGLELSSGKYIMFLDSDDFLEPDICRHLLVEAELKNADIVEFSYNTLYENEFDDGINSNGKLIPIPENYPPTHEDYFHLTPIVMWNKLYRKSLFDNNKIKLCHSSVFEDSGILPLIMAYSRYYCSLNKIGYNYRRREGSNVSKSYKKEFIPLNLETQIALLNEFEDRGLLNTHANYLFLFSMGVIFFTDYWLLGYRTFLDRKLYFKEIICTYYVPFFNKTKVTFSWAKSSKKNFFKYIFIKFALLRFDSVSLSIFLAFKFIFNFFSNNK